MTETPREDNKLVPPRVENDNSENLIQEFKSYPDMCRRLNLEIKTGGAKINQMKEIGKRFHLEVKGQKIVLRGKREIERREGEEREWWEKLEKDCEMGRRDVDGRKTLLILQLWKKLALQEISSESTPLVNFRDSSGFSTDIEVIGFSHPELASSLRLVNQDFREGKIEATKSGTEVETTFFREITTQNKVILDSLFGVLWKTNLMNGYKSWEVSFEKKVTLPGEKPRKTGFLNSEDSLWISTLKEKILEHYGFTCMQGAVLHNKSHLIYKELNEIVLKEFGITWMEEAYVIQTSEFLLSRYILKNVSKSDQRVLIRKLQEDENILSASKLRRKIQDKVEADRFALTGMSLSASGLDEEGKLVFFPHTEESLERVEMEKINIKEREKTRLQIVSDFVKIEPLKVTGA